MSKIIGKAVGAIFKEDTPQTPHEKNKDIHVTKEEKDKWNALADSDISDILGEELTGEEALEYAFELGLVKPCADEEGVVYTDGNNVVYYTLE